MKDERPIVYIARRIVHIDENQECYTLAYFVSKAHLKSKTKIFYKTTKSNSYEYEVDCGEFNPDYPLGYFNDIPNWCMPEITKPEFISKNFKSCKRYVDRRNKELLEDHPDVTNSYIIKKVQDLEVFNISEEERLGIEETKKDL